MPNKLPPEIAISTKTKIPIATALLLAISVTAYSSALGISAAYAGLLFSRKAAPSSFRTNTNVNANVNVRTNVNANVNANVNSNVNAGQTVSVNTGAAFIRGDANMDGVLDVGDVTAIANYVNAGGALSCLDAADANDSGNVDIHDVAYLTIYLFSGGPEPAAPFPKTGADPTTVDPLDCSGISRRAAPPATFIRGDANMDSQIDIGDAIAIANYVNSKGTLKCLDAADANDSGNVGVEDMAYMMWYLYSGGAAPKSPFPAAGEDPTADDLTCE